MAIGDKGVKIVRPEDGGGLFHKPGTDADIDAGFDDIDEYDENVVVRRRKRLPLNWVIRLRNSRSDACVHANLDFTRITFFGREKKREGRIIYVFLDQTLFILGIIVISIHMENLVSYV